ncbi:MAG: bifunctional DNA primase/polymerase, partial [Chloroflexi bacterium]|nr:bifunctional DNA primase/polymerase [Chloroflexota bacterium]
MAREGTAARALMGADVSTMLDAALKYAAQGRRVFPLQWAVDGKCSCQKRSNCGSPAKHPKTDNGLTDATLDATKIRGWWGEHPQANVGLLMGDGLIAIDIDPDKGGSDSIANLGELPDTVTSLTGGGGRHFIYHTDQDYKNTSGVVGPGIDVRSAGGYIVAPPSLHVSGRQYEWEIGHGPGDMRAAPLPDAFKSLMQNGQRAPAPEVGEIIPDGERNGTLASIAGTLRRRGLGETEIAAALLEVNANRCDPPLPDPEVQAIAASVARYPAGKTEAPTPRAPTPTLAPLLGDVLAYIRQYVVLSDAQADAITLWVAHTHALDAAESTPYLAITSAEKRSGKTLLLEVLQLIVARPWFTGRVTPAALYRRIDKECPTLLLDESD